MDISIERTFNELKATNLFTEALQYLAIFTAIPCQNISLLSRIYKLYNVTKCQCRYFIKKNSQHFQGRKIKTIFGIIFDCKIKVKIDEIFYYYQKINILSFLLFLFQNFPISVDFLFFIWLMNFLTTFWLKDDGQKIFTV